MTQDIYQKNMIANDGESASFSRLVYKSTIGICVIGKQDRQLLYVNEKMKRFMPEAEIKSRICWNIKHPEEEPCMYCLPFSDSEAGISYEVKVQGEERYCSIVFEEIDWLGTPAYAEYITDITEQVRIQRKEIDLEARKKLMLDNAGGIGLLMVEIEGDAVNALYISDNLAKMCGYSVQELKTLCESKEVLERITGDSKLFSKALQQIRESDDEVTIPLHLHTSRGESLFVSAVYKRIRRENGKIYVQGAFMEIPALTLLYQHILDDTAAGILVTDRETHEVYYANKAFRDLMSVTDADYRGKRCYEYIRGRKEACDSCIGLKLKLNETGEHIKSFQNPGKYVSTKSTLINWAGRPALVEYFTDITEDYLRHAQASDLLNRVPGGIAICKYDNLKRKVTVQYLNDGYYRMVGESREKREPMLRKEFLHYVHPQDVHLIEQQNEAMMNGAPSGTCEYRLMCGPKGYRWIRVSVSVVDRTASGFVAYCCYADIHDRIEATVNLEQANAELHAQFEREHQRRQAMEKDCLYADSFNVTENHMIASSAEHPGTSNVKSLDLEAAVDFILEKIPLEKDRNRLREFFSREKMMHDFANGRRDDVIEYRSTRKDGRLRWMRALSSLVEDPISRDLIEYTYIYDVDREKKKQLAMSMVMDEEFESVFLVHVSSGTAEDVSHGPTLKIEKTEHMIRVSDIANLSTFPKFIEKDRKTARKFFDLCYLTAQLKSSASVTCTCTCEDGAVKQIRAFYLDETKEEIVVAERDITDITAEQQKQQAVLQQALTAANAANEAKSEFLSRMSHDIRTPMNGIVGMTRLVRQSQSREERDHYLDELEVSSKYLLGLLNDILTMSKISEGKVTLKPEAVKTIEFLNQLVHLIQVQADEKGITLITEIGSGPDIPYQLFDKLRVQQIVFNILNNAVKYTPAGGIVHYTASHFEREGRIWCRHEVTDNGVGMSQEFMKTIFTPFVQEENSQSSLTCGTGLGLSICKQLCDLMGGDIEVESTLGKGSTFIVEVPTHPLSKEEYEQRVQLKADGYETVMKPDSLSGRHILLCEDNRVNCEILEKLLENQGAEVTCKENGAQGLKAYEDSELNEYDAVLMDIRMPVMDGLTAARAIRAANRSDATTIAIIAISANAFAEDVDASRAAGMNDHLAKPVEPQKLFSTLIRWIGKVN